MTAIPLLHSTGQAQADRALQGVVTLFESVFPQRIVGYYIEGSYADQTAVATSDLDLTIVFYGQFVTTAERQQAHEVVTACRQLSVVELDITLAEESELRRGADPMFKLGARLLYGQDRRDAIPLLPIEIWGRQRMHAAYWLMINVFNRPKPVVAPLTFPDPQDPFYGYAARMMHLADGRTIPTTRNLIRVTGWIATARLAYEAQHYVVRKRDCVPAYRRLIHDEWTTLLEGINERCRAAWRYHIPSTPAEQAELRTITADTLRFENHFLGCYRNFLLTQFTGADPEAQQAAEGLWQNTPYADPLILHARAAR